MNGPGRFHEPGSPPRKRFPQPVGGPGRERLGGAGDGADSQQCPDRARRVAESARHRRGPHDTGPELRLRGSPARRRRRRGAGGASLHDLRPLGRVRSRRHLRDPAGQQRCRPVGQGAQTPPRVRAQAQSTRRGARPLRRRQHSCPRGRQHRVSVPAGPLGSLQIPARHRRPGLLRRRRPRSRSADQQFSRRTERDPDGVVPLGELVRSGRRRRPRPRALHSDPDRDAPGAATSW